MKDDTGTAYADKYDAGFGLLYLYVTIINLLSLGHLFGGVMGKMKKRISIPLAIFLIAICTIWGWHYYMQLTWDNHIVSSSPRAFDAQYLDDHHGYPLNAEETAALPEQYKQHVEIIEREDAYYWVNNDNLRLEKTVEKNGDLKWIIFSSPDDSVEIKIQGNNYVGPVRNNVLEIGCNTRSWDGNGFIHYKNYKLTTNKYLVANVVTKFYENPFQYIFCKDRLKLSL